MRNKAALVASGLLVVLAVFVVAGLLTVEDLCACEGADIGWSREIGASPMSADSTVVRTKLLKRLPVGSSLAEIDDLVAGATLDKNGIHRNRLCERSPKELSCNFPVKGGWWGYYKSGFRVSFLLDASDRLADARIAPYTAWFSDAVSERRI